MPSYNTQPNPSMLDESAQALEKASQTVVRRAGFTGGCRGQRKKVPVETFPLLVSAQQLLLISRAKSVKIMIFSCSMKLQYGKNLQGVCSPLPTHPGPALCTSSSGILQLGSAASTAQALCCCKQLPQLAFTPCFKQAVYPLPVSAAKIIFQLT